MNLFSSFLQKLIERNGIFSMYALNFSSHFLVPPTVFHNQKRTFKCPFISNLVPGQVEKENHIRKVTKSEERKVKNRENL